MRIFSALHRPTTCQAPPGLSPLLTFSTLQVNVTLKVFKTCLAFPLLLHLICFFCNVFSSPSQPAKILTSFQALIQCFQITPLQCATNNKGYVRMASPVQSLGMIIKALSFHPGNNSVKQARDGKSLFLPSWRPAPGIKVPLLHPITVASE